MQISLFTSLFIMTAVYQQNMANQLHRAGLPSTVTATIFYLFLFTIVSPFLCAILVDRGFKLLCKTCFYLMIAWFSSYAFARCWTLTWVKVVMVVKK